MPGVWQALSEVTLAEAQDNRESLRRFCGCSSGEATPERTAFPRRIAVTETNVADARGAAGLLRCGPGRVCAYLACDQGSFKSRIHKGRGEPMIVRRRHKRSRAALDAAKRAGNAAIHPTRACIENVFCTAKRSYGLARARDFGRRRVSPQVHLTFIAPA